MIFRPLPVLSVASVAALVLLLLLGQWQWSRYELKTEARQAAPSRVSLVAAEPLTDAAQYVFAVHHGVQGWRVFIPVRTLEQGTVFVDAGFAPGLDPPASPPALVRAGEGLHGEPIASGPSRGLFAQDGAFGDRQWARPDPAAMAAAAGLEAAPFWLALADRYGEGPNPFTPGADPLPPERHLGYALTWWGLAASLVVMYFVFHARVGRLKLSR